MSGAVAHRAEWSGLNRPARHKDPHVNAGQRPAGRGIDRHAFERRILSEGAEAEEKREHGAVPHARTIAPVSSVRIEDIG